MTRKVARKVSDGGMSAGTLHRRKNQGNLPVTAGRGFLLAIADRSNLPQR
jgi:hypothetical protein